jgi:serine/threonine protein kinase/Tfp pilus assembly protein PilF
MAAPTQLVGQILGHYRILEQIGAGGMGVVYRAHDDRLDRDIALKVLPSGALADEAARKRFRKEALALSRLNHPNIAMVFDFDTQDGMDFLVTEYIPGTTLDASVGPGFLPEKQVVRLGLQLAEGLTAAHEQGVVHRDLKPSNLRIMPDGRLKILDFGIAKLLPTGEREATETLTEATGVTGTLPYMAPEQLRGEQPDSRTDIYAAGAVLYEMATGRRPFEQRLSTVLADDIIHKAPVSPAQINAKLSPKVDDIILKCLEKEPENRYQSAKELAVDMRRLAFSSTAQVTARPMEAGPRLRRTVAVAGIAGLCGLALLFALNVGGWRERLLGARGPAIRSIAVLPLENLSRDPEQEYFADGMTDALITDLSKIGSLRIISRTSAMHYKGANKTLPEIAKELNVDGIVEGSVMRSGNRVRITAQLIHARSDQHLWAETYERDVGDVLKLQGEVAQAIAQQVRVQLTPQQQARLGSASAVNPGAYQAYLKGRSYWGTALATTPQALKTAQSYFEEAIQEDSGFAPAYAGLADCYLSLGSYRRLPPQDAYRDAKEATRKALELDETLGEAHTTLGWLSWRHDWDWRTAEREFDYALELNPNYVQGHVELSAFLAWSGRRTEALAEVAKIRQLDPAYPFALGAEAGIYYFLSDYKATVEVSRKSVTSNPNEWLGHLFLAVGYEGLGHQLDAIPEYQKAVELSQGDTDPMAGLAHAYAVTGRRADAEKILRELQRQSKTSYVSPYHIATIYAGLGDKDRAFEFLEKAYRERSSDLPYFLKFDLRIDNLRSDPRFQDLVRRVGLP